MVEGNVRIMCPSLTCRRVLVVPTSSRGKTVRCKNCGTTIRVPQKPAASQQGGAAEAPEAASAEGATKK